MRLLIVSTFFPPLNSIASMRPYSWAKYWIEEGHDVTVLTKTVLQEPRLDLVLPETGCRVIRVPLPAFIEKMKTGYSSKVHADEVPPSWIKRHVGKWLESLRERTGILNACRMPDLTDLWVKPALKALEGEGSWDCVISTAGPYSVHRVGHQLKKRGQAQRWVADYRDFWSTSCIYPGLFPFTLYERYLERKLIKDADAVTVVSKQFKEYFERDFNFPNVHAVENGFDPEALTNIDAAPYFPDDGKMRIAYTGTIYGVSQDPSPLFAAISEMADDPLLDRLEVLFSGVRSPFLKEMIEKFGVQQWVKEVGFLSRSDALRMQRDASFLLFLPWSDPKWNGMLTGKVFEYIFSGTPIIAVGAPEGEAAQEIILESKAGTALPSKEAVKAFLTQRLREPHYPKVSADSQVLERYSRRALSKLMLTYQGL